VRRLGEAEFSASFQTCLLATELSLWIRAWLLGLYMRQLVVLVVGVLSLALPLSDVTNR